MSFHIPSRILDVGTWDNWRLELYIEVNVARSDVYRAEKSDYSLAWQTYKRQLEATRRLYVWQVGE